MTDEQKILYHYTSVDALFNIVQSKTFWLANAKSSNDQTEGVFTEEEFNRIIKLARNDISDDEKQNFDDFFSQRPTIDLNSKDNYILCLSKLKDSLAHWDRYASFRKGICICIDVKKLSELNSNIFSFFQIYELGYLDDDLKNELIGEFKKYLKMPKRCIDEDSKNIVQRAKLYVIRYYLFIKKKNPYFKDEEEVRVSASPYIYLRAVFPQIDELEDIKQKSLSLLDKFDIEKTYFAPIRGEIRSLHHLCLKDIWGSDLIPEIMLGPNCPQSKDELRAFLDANGLENTKITISKIPIR